MERLLTWRQKYATPLHKMSYLLEEIATVPNERKRNWAAIKLLCMVAVPYFHNGVRRSLSQLMSDPQLCNLDWNHTGHETYSNVELLSGSATIISFNQITNLKCFVWYPRGG